MYIGSAIETCARYSPKSDFQQHDKHLKEQERAEELKSPTTTNSLKPFELKLDFFGSWETKERDTPSRV